MVDTIKAIGIMIGKIVGLLIFFIFSETTSKILGLLLVGVGLVAFAIMWPPILVLYTIMVGGWLLRN